MTTFFASGPDGPLQDAMAIAAACQTPNAGGTNVTPLLTRPETICIVCLGGSMTDHVREQMTTGRYKNPYDEIWTLNRGIRGFPHDKLFMLDDMRWLAKKDPHYGKFMERHDKPIITSTVYPEFPMACQYPYQEVLAHIGDDIFNVNTVAYMVAYAMYIGVKEMSLFGADFFYPNGSTAESGGQAVAHLLGLCRFFGIRFKVPQTSTLLYANTVKQLGPNQVGRPPYGWHRRAELTEEEKGLPQLAVG